MKARRRSDFQKSELRTPIEFRAPCGHGLIVIHHPQHAQCTGYHTLLMYVTENILCGHYKSLFQHLPPQWQHKHNNLTMARIRRRPMVHPAAFGLYSMNTRPIDTKLGEGTYHEPINDLVLYCSHSTFIRCVYNADR